MSTTFDKYEEQFVALVAKAGCSLAQVSSHPSSPAEKASTTSSAAADDDDDDSPMTADSAPTDTTLLSDMEHVQVAAMLLGQAFDHLDAMEVEWRLVNRALTRSSRSTRKRGQAVLSDLRRRLDGCSDICNALRSECRAARARLRDAGVEDEATAAAAEEEVHFEQQQQPVAKSNESANANADASLSSSTRPGSGDAGGNSKKSKKKVKQWTCDVCKVAKFADYDEACRHEETCDGKAKPSPPPDEDDLSYKQQSSRSGSSRSTAKGRSPAANAYRSSLFEKAERANATLASQNATLENARRVMADTEATAGTITEELARNRETIESAQGKVGELHGMSNSARRTIQTMQRRKKYLF